MNEIFCCPNRNRQFLYKNWQQLENINQLVTIHPNGTKLNYMAYKFLYFEELQQAAGQKTSEFFLNNFGLD